MGFDEEQITHWDGVGCDDRGPWADTYSGGRFYPLDPRPGEFRLEDVAHHLSMVNRFSGATPYPYSVAQHLMLCGVIADWVFPERDELWRWALIHDAPEYVLGDHIRPVKINLTQFGPMEDRAMAALAEQLGLAPLSCADQIALRHIDNIALAVERRELLPRAPVWPGLPTVPNERLAYFVGQRQWRDVRHQFATELRRAFPEWDRAQQ